MKLCIIALIAWFAAVQASPAGPTIKLLKDFDRSAEKFRSSIINGKPAPKDVRYMCMLKLNGRFNCGCSIIHEKFALTAAHCVEGTVTITVNKYHVNSNDQGEVTFRAAKVKRHEGYTGSDTYYVHDIALVLLDGTTESPVEPILPAPESVGDLVGAKANLTGWGLYNRNSGEQKSELLTSKFTAISNSDCKTKTGFNDYIHQTTICVENVDTSICFGDSGGPLVTKVNNKLVQIGITSLVRSDCPVNFPGMFTRVSKYEQWIKDGIQELL